MINKYIFSIFALLYACIILQAAHEQQNCLAFLDMPQGATSLAEDEAIMNLFDTCMVDQKEDDNAKLAACLARKPTIYKKNNHSLLIEAASDGCIVLAQAIIKACPQYCADTPECCDERGWHPLHYVVRPDANSPHMHACIDMLAAFVNVRTKDDETPLMLAQHPASAAHLIALGADVYAIDAYGLRALPFHITYPNADMVRFFLTQDDFKHAGPIPKSKALHQYACYTIESISHRYLNNNQALDEGVSLEEVLKAVHDIHILERIKLMLNTPISDEERAVCREVIKKYLPIKPNALLRHDMHPCRKRLPRLAPCTLKSTAESTPN